MFSSEQKCYYSSWKMKKKCKRILHENKICVDVSTLWGRFPPFKPDNDHISWTNHSSLQHWENSLCSCPEKRHQFIFAGYCWHVHVQYRQPVQFKLFLEFPTVSNSFMLHFDRKTNFRKGLPDFGVMPSARWWHLAPEFPVARCCVPGDMKGGQVGQGCTTCCSVAAGLRENGEKFILGRIRCEKAPQVVPAWSAVKECLFQVTSARVSDLSKTLCLCVPVIPIHNRKVQVDNLLLDQPYSQLLEDLATNSYLHNL